MKQLFYAPDIDTNSVLPEDESQHCANVLRLKDGEEITVTDGKGYFYTAVLNGVHPKHCRLDVKERKPQKRLRDYMIHIAVAPTKNIDRMEWFVEKAVEIGVNAITFLLCRYSERKVIKSDRLQRIAVSAMKQSQKASLPEISEMIDYENFISKSFDGRKMIAHCGDGEKFLIKDIYQPPDNALILIGPEGDFDRKEIKMALSERFTPVSLGDSRLRTETAALIACHTIHLLNQ
ncbi:MAG: 16S rRNA (uracil(1498)-N(3))-methyltransferase [Tannerella sp.]|jgi:16S rRNA (uracil1498-N3)-methyltransferase|nr:16S rRNA (uracil(1498)-N(3))-methyltransferase [Tannerella sp.]